MVASFGLNIPTNKKEDEHSSTAPTVTGTVMTVHSVLDAAVPAIAHTN